MDLNGKTINATPCGSYPFAVAGSNLTLKNGKLVTNKYGIGSGGDGASLNVIVLENMILEAGSVGVYHNGSYYGVDVTVKDSTINGSDVGIFLSGSKSWNAQNQLNIVNSTIIGSTAVEAKHTDISVTDSTLTATEEEATRNSTSGNCTVGFALALTNNTTSSSKEATSGSVNLYGVNNITGRMWVKAEDAVYVTTNAAGQVTIPAGYAWVNGVLTQS